MGEHLFSDLMFSSVTASQCKPKLQPEPELRIRVTVFIDGTLNNKWNTWIREKGGTATPGSSYMNDLSNVARLSVASIPDPSQNFHYMKYVEGMGTLYNHSDDWIDGTVFGKGCHGIVDRAEDCFEDVISHILWAAAGHSKITSLKVDCFGFSRGAAAARYFVSLLTDAETGLLARIDPHKPVVNSDFEIPFVGLFDTVAHYGWEMKDDTQALKLDAIAHFRVKRVVQLAAGDEHRYNFPLTNIDSTVKYGNGIQVFFPGVHSDVGGSYNDLSKVDQLEKLPLFEILGGEDDDKLYLARCNTIRQELIDLGWYTADEITLGKDMASYNEDDPIYKYSVLVRREGIRNTYSVLPLHFMVKKASEKQLWFDITRYRYSGHPILSDIRPVIENNTFDDVYWLNNKDPRIKALRHGYLHFSSHYIRAKDILLTCTPQFYDKNGKTEDEKFENSSRNKLHGTRRRRIYPG